MSSKRNMDVLTRDGAAAHVSARSAQNSHDDASVMISSAERALAVLHDSLNQDPKTLPPRKPAVVTLPITREPRAIMRWIGASTVLACTLVLAGAFVWWPTVSGSARLDASPVASVIDAAELSLPIDSSETLPRPSASDGISQMYAAEFGRSDKASLRCLAEAVYYEARGEPYIGQVAVAQVVLNRARSGKWSRSICGVITQGIERGEKCQFSYMCRTARATPVGAMWDRAQEVAIDAARGRVWLRELVEATHYHTTAVSPVWRQGLDVLVTHGSHIFYRTPELGYALSITKATEQPAEERRSHEATSAKSDVAQDFKLPAGTVATPGLAPPVVHRPVARAPARDASAQSAAAPKRSDDSWIRDLQNR